MTQTQTSRISDSQLLARFGDDQDQRAFAELVRRHGPMVYATASRVLRTREDVEDVFQATMFTLAKAAGKLKRHGSIAGWLHNAAYGCAVEVRRANARWERKADRMTEQLATTDCQSGNSDPSHTLARNESESILHEELARLSEKVRTVIVLCELEGVPQKQVAQQLGIPTSTVNNRIAKLPPTARWDP